MVGEEDSFALGRQSAKAEAFGLYRMLGHDGNTIEAIRELIDVPPKIECVLRAFARAHPEEAHSIEKNLKFRQAVAREFEKLLCDGVPVAEPPGVDGGELEAEFHEARGLRFEFVAQRPLSAKRRQFGGPVPGWQPRQNGTMSLSAREV